MVIKEYIAAIIGLGFIYLIFLRIFHNSTYAKKSLISLIIGIVLNLSFVGAVIYDYNKVAIPKFNFLTAYYSFLIISILYSIVMPLVYLILARSRKGSFQKYNAKRTKVVIKPTIKESIVNVYIVYKYNGNYLLDEDTKNGEKIYKGITKRLTSKMIFHDEFISEYIKNQNIQVLNYKLVGEATLKSKVDYLHYCYIIDVSEITDDLKKLVEISPYDLVNYPMLQFDKEIIFHMVLRDYFKIEIKE